MFGMAREELFDHVLELVSYILQRKANVYSNKHVPDGERRNLSSEKRTEILIQTY